ncbi:MAG TPA: NAD(P)-dependent oxidoreductase [Solirubrobacteraceae bacterium]|nr:NAD(P)-dependent oxidoreductase [Solirubrobacteraceae bacterium]
MKVLVAGAGGAIGIPLIQRLVAEGHEVVGMTRSPERGRAIRGSGAQSVLCDVLYARQLTDTVARIAPDAIIHELTALPDRYDPKRLAEQLAPTNRLRREGTAHLIAAASEAGVSRLVAQSVAFAYAPTGGWIKDEEAPLHLDARPPQDEVVAAVADLERQVLDVSGVVLRYGYFYGPGTQFGGRGAYAEMARRRMLPIVPDAEGHWSFIHVRDAADATARALQHGDSGVYNVVDDEPAPAREWIPGYATAVGAGRPLKLPEFIGVRLLGSVAVSAMKEQRGASNAKARAHLDWSPEHGSWRTGFRQAIVAENRERYRWFRR